MRHLLLFLASILCSIEAFPAVNGQTFTFDPVHNLSLTRYTSDAADARQSPSPCIIFAFGGGFTHGQRDDARYMDYFRFMAEHGYVVCTIDYRTTLADFSPSSPDDAEEEFGEALVEAITTATTDFLTATGYVLANASQWAVDPSRIIASGSSAGAITALEAEYTLLHNRPTALPPTFNYAAAVTFAGALLSQGQPRGLDRFCPAMLFQGDADRQVPYNVLTVGPLGFYGSKWLAGKLKDAGCAGAFYTRLGAGHEMALTPMTSNLYDIAGFLDRILSGAPKQYDWTVVTLPDTPAYRTDFSILDYIQANQ